MNSSLGYASTTRMRAREDGALELLTSKGNVVIIDADAQVLLPKGFLHISTNGYARIEVDKRGRRANPFIHRLVLGLEPGDGKEVDHINGQKLDNRRSNLRVVSRSVNQLNKRKAFSSNATGFLGVAVDSRRKAKKYRASLIIGKKRIHVGCFATPEEAHEAYMRAKESVIGEIKC